MARASYMFGPPRLFCIEDCPDSEQIAAQEGHEDLIDLFLENGADPNAVDDDGE